MCIEPEYVLSSADYERCSRRHLIDHETKRPIKALSEREKLLADLATMSQSFSRDDQLKQMKILYSALDDTRAVFKILLRPPSSSEMDLAAGVMFEPKHAAECVLPTTIRSDPALITALLDDLETKLCDLIRGLSTVAHRGDPGTRTLNIYDDRISWRNGAPQKREFLPVLDTQKWTSVQIRVPERVQTKAEQLHTAVEGYFSRLTQPGQFLLYEIILARCRLSICPNRYLLATHAAVNSAIATRINEVCEAASVKRREEVEAGVSLVTIDDPTTRVLDYKERVSKCNERITVRREELQSKLAEEEKFLVLVRSTCRGLTSSRRKQELRKYEQKTISDTLNGDDAIRIQKSVLVSRHMFTFVPNVNLCALRETEAATQTLIESRVRWFLGLLESDSSIAGMCNSFFVWNAKQTRCFISEMVVQWKPEGARSLAILKAFIHVFAVLVYPLYTGWSGSSAFSLVAPKKKRVSKQSKSVASPPLISSINKVALTTCMAMGARPDQGVHFEADIMAVRALGKLEFELWCALLDVSDTDRDTFARNFGQLVQRSAPAFHDLSSNSPECVKKYCRQFAVWSRDTLCLNASVHSGKLFAEFTCRAMEKQLLKFPHSFRGCVASCAVEHSPESNIKFAAKEYAKRLVGVKRTHSDPLVPGTLIAFWLGLDALRPCKRFRDRFPLVFPADVKRDTTKSDTPVRNVRILRVVEIADVPENKTKRKRDEKDELESGTRPPPPRLAASPFS